MFNLGLSEIVLISIIALIFIGPKQLPEIARTIGRALNELKRASEDLSGSITNVKSYSQEEAPPPLRKESAPADETASENKEKSSST